MREAKQAEKDVTDKYLALFKQHTTADERLVRPSAPRPQQLAVAPVTTNHASYIHTHCLVVSLTRISTLCACCHVSISW